MTTLINNKHLLSSMPVAINVGGLEEKISELLDRATPLIPKQGCSINLYLGRPASYIASSDGIRKYWKAHFSNGTPYTTRSDLTKEEFLQWVSEQPGLVKEEVYRNLETYISTETPTERGEVEVPALESFFFLD